ncbi:MAG: response regulator [Pseudomonadota bacterium]
MPCITGFFDTLDPQIFIQGIRLFSEELTRIRDLIENGSNNDGNLQVIESLIERLPNAGTSYTTPNCKKHDLLLAFDNVRRQATKLYLMVAENFTVSWCAFLPGHKKIFLGKHHLFRMLCMKKKTIALVIADNNESLDRTVSGIKSNTIEVYGTMDSTVCVEYFVKYRPNIVFFSFDSVSAAERLYLIMVHAAMSAPPFFYQTVLLCAGREAKKACELCLKNVFDEYVIDKPLYDYYQIFLIIRRALERHKRIGQSGSAGQAALPVPADTVEILNGIRAAINGGKNSGYSAKAQLDSVKKSIDDFVSKLTSSFAEEKHNGVVRALDAEKIQQAIGDMKRNHLDKKISDASKIFNDQIDGLVANMEKGQAAADGALKKFAQWAAEKIWSVLVVEDDPIFQDIIQRTLKAEKYEVACAASGPEVLSLLNGGQHFDFIFMDYELPSMNGADIIKWVRAYPAMEKTPVVMLTGHSDKATIKQAVEAGAADFVVKPANRTIILEKVAKHLGFKPSSPAK